jgi:hypothetical protein
MPPRAPRSSSAAPGAARAGSSASVAAIRAGRRPADRTGSDHRTRRRGPPQRPARPAVQGASRRPDPAPRRRRAAIASSRHALNTRPRAQAPAPASKPSRHSRASGPAPPADGPPGRRRAGPARPPNPARRRVSITNSARPGPAVTSDWRMSPVSTDWTPISTKAERPRAIALSTASTKPDQAAHGAPPTGGGQISPRDRPVGDGREQRTRRRAWGDRAQHGRRLIARRVRKAAAEGMLRQQAAPGQTLRAQITLQFRNVFGAVRQRRGAAPVEGGDLQPAIADRGQGDRVFMGRPQRHHRPARHAQLDRHAALMDHAAGLGQIEGARGPGRRPLTPRMADQR